MRLSHVFPDPSNSGPSIAAVPDEPLAPLVHPVAFGEPPDPVPPDPFASPPLTRVPPFEMAAPPLAVVPPPPVPIPGSASRGSSAR